jgi:hypothetical protein
MRIITFDTETHAGFDDYAEAGGAVFDDWYAYDPETGTGTIGGGYPAGDFMLKDDNKLMFFPDYKSYGHGAEFHLLEEE